MTLSLSNCRLCPRECGVDRAAGRLGYCRAGARTEIYRYGVHRGEEPPVSGERGSGAIFFSRCTMRCLYCQNHPWSQGGEGRTYGEGELAEVFRSVAAEGCHNWNLVSPTPWLPQILEALDAVEADGISLPVVYNTSGFERVEVLDELGDRVDVYLTDLRYSREESAALGSGAPGYVAAAREAMKAMWRLAGPLALDGGGVAVRGVICRILILPGRAAEAVENLRWLAEEIGTEVAVSVMAQYTPTHRATGCPPWDRLIAAEEYEAVCREVEALGFGNGWIQEFGLPPPDGLLGADMKRVEPAGTSSQARDDHGRMEQP